MQFTPLSTFSNRADTTTMFTSFDVPQWTVPRSVITDSIAEAYKHMFTSFEVPSWMLQGVNGVSERASRVSRAA